MRFRRFLVLGMGALTVLALVAVLVAVLGANDARPESSALVATDIVVAKPSSARARPVHVAKPGCCGNKTEPADVPMADHRLKAELVDSIEHWSVAAKAGTARFQIPALGRLDFARFALSGEARGHVDDATSGGAALIAPDLRAATSLFSGVPDGVAKAGEPSGSYVCVSADANQATWVVREDGGSWREGIRVAIGDGWAVSWERVVPGAVAGEEPHRTIVWFTAASAAR
ncbi:MAG: hypothetical protein H0W72_01865 [Planctomycetes bacterium]|nr:hypothetical protein [Planctomycetota bacterium]